MRPCEMGSKPGAYRLPAERERWRAATHKTSVSPIAAANPPTQAWTPFLIPGEASHPPPLEAPDGARNTLVALAVPIRQAGAVEGTDVPTEGRYFAHPFEVYETHTASSAPAGLQVARLGMRDLPKSEERTGCIAIPPSRITEILRS